MASEEITVSGLDELGKRLEELPPKVARRIVRPAVNAGGQVFEAALHATVPKDQGALDAAIGRKIRVSNNLEDCKAIMGPRYEGGHRITTQDPGVYGFFQEKGTRNMPGKFWVYRAFEMSKRTAFDATVKVLGQLLELVTK